MTSSRNGPVLVPLDGTPASEQALSWSTYLAQRLSGGLLLVHAVERQGGHAASEVEVGELALPEAITMARALETAIHLVHADETYTVFSDFPYLDVASIVALTDDSEQYLRSTASRLSDQGIRVTIERDWANPTRPFGAPSPDAMHRWS
ncbi:MAG: hypothetical protein ACRDIY_15910 [Chloroflexota bacterium]